MNVAAHARTQIFGVPPQARRAKPFIDHVMSFSILDGKIWVRNFQVRLPVFVVAQPDQGAPLSQIVEKDPAIDTSKGKKDSDPTSLVEIGPRFVLTPIRIFEGAFSGTTVFSNPGMHPRHPCVLVPASSDLYLRVRVASGCPRTRPEVGWRQVQVTQGRTSRAGRAEGGPEVGRRPAIQNQSFRLDRVRYLHNSNAFCSAICRRTWLGLFIQSLVFTPLCCRRAGSSRRWKFISLNLLDQCYWRPKGNQISSGALPCVPRSFSCPLRRSDIWAANHLHTAVSCSLRSAHSRNEFVLEGTSWAPG